MVEVGRRRRWSTAAKLRIVEESFAEPRRVSATARQHGISRSLLMTWRRAYRAGRLGADTAPDFLPVTVDAEPGAGGAGGGTGSEGHAARERRRTD